jgi:hypothetical protein
LLTYDQVAFIVRQQQQCVVELVDLGANYLEEYMMHAIAFRLTGLELVLVGRNLDKLAVVATKIRAKHPKVLEVCDFAGKICIIGLMETPHM